MITGLEVISAELPPIERLSLIIAPTPMEPIELLTVTLAEAVQAHQALALSAASSVVSLLVAKVRLSFLLNDAQELLGTRGGFCEWASAHVALSLNSIYAIRKLSRFFSRDLECLALRKSFGLPTAGIEFLPGEPLSVQVTKSGAKSLSSLFRTIGVLDDCPRDRPERKRQAAAAPPPSDDDADQVGQGREPDLEPPVHDHKEVSEDVVTNVTEKGNSSGKSVPNVTSDIEEQEWTPGAGTNGSSPRQEPSNGALPPAVHHRRPLPGHVIEAPAIPHAQIYAAIRELLCRLEQALAFPLDSLTDLEKRQLVFKYRGVSNVFQQLAEETALYARSRS